VKLAGRALLALIVATAPLAARGADPVPIEVPVQISLTGSAAFVGKSITLAMNAAEGTVNRQGGIRGRPIKFVVVDDQSNAQTAVSLAGQQLSKNVPLLVAGIITSTCFPIAALLKDNGPVLYCFSSTVHSQPGSWVYSTNFATQAAVPGGLRFVKQHGWRKIGFIVTNDATGQEVDGYLAAALTLPDLRDIEIVSHEHFAVPDLSVDAQMARIKSAGAQVLVTWTSGTPLGTVLRGAQNVGLGVPVLASGANLSYLQMEQYRSLMPEKGLYVVGIPAVDPSTIRDRAVRRSIDEFNDAMKGVGARGDIGAAIGWNTAMVIVDAYRRVGPTPTAAQLRDAINAIRGRDSIYGRMDFQESPQRGITPYWLMVDRWDPAADRFVAVSKPGDLVAPK
jgi:branched-chain amino acid transport system substrate-binding protein